MKRTIFNKVGTETTVLCIFKIVSVITFLKLVLLIVPIKRIILRKYLLRELFLRK